MSKRSHIVGIEINPKLLGVLLTDRVGNTLRIFCFDTNGSSSQFNVPADENGQSQNELFSALNIEPTCTSVIKDAAVQGRIYIQTDDQHWLYTLLNTPGSRLPLNAAIGDLPWEVIWRSETIEALKYQPESAAEPSFALRYSINKNDDPRLVKNPKFFLNPVSPPTRMPQRRLHVNTGIALLAIALLVAATWYYLLKPRSLSARSVPSANNKVTQAAAEVSGGYFLLYNRQISGPYPAATLARMNAAGLFNPDAMCRAGQSTVWVKLATAFPAPTRTH